MAKRDTSSTPTDAALFVGEPTADAEAGSSGTTSPVASAVKGAADQATQTGGQLIDKAREQGTQQARQQKEKAAESLVTLAGSLRKMGDEVEGQDQSAIASVTRLTADKTEELAKFLRQTDVTEMVGQVETFARRQPALFLGAAFGAGLIISRFLKAAQSGRGGSQQGISQQGLSQTGASDPFAYGGSLSGADAYETSLARDTTSGL